MANSGFVISMSKKAEEAAPVGRLTNLYMTINTVDVNGKTVGYRIVDLYHYCTRNWLMNHQWWAMHQGHLVEVQPATAEEINEYLAKKAKELQDKFADAPAQELVAA